MDVRSRSLPDPDSRVMDRISKLKKKKQLLKQSFEKLKKRQI